MADILSFMRAEAERNRRDAANNAAMQQRDPVAVARARRLEKVYGIPAPVIEADPKPFEEQLTRDRAEATISQFPWMAGVLAADRDLAATVGKDLPRIGDIAGTLTNATLGKPIDVGAMFPNTQGTPRPRQARRAPPVPNRAIRTLKTAKGIVGIAGLNIGRALAGGAETITSNVLEGDDDIIERTFAPAYRGLQKAQDQVEQGIMADMPWISPGWKQGLFSGAVSTVNLAATLPAGTAKVLPLLTGLTYGSAYQKYRGRGVGNERALLGAGLEAAIEYGTERIPTGIMLRAFGEPGKGFINNMARSYGIDVFGEQAATFGQALTEEMIGSEDGKSQTFGEFLTDPARVEQAWETLVATTFMSAAATGGGMAYRRLQRTANSATDSLDSLIGQAVLDDVMAQAEKTEVRKVAPEDFARMINEGVQGTPVRNVYIPVEAIDKALADETLPEEERSALTLYQSQIEEARATGGEVVIPIGDAAALLAGTKLWQSVRDDTRVLAGGISGREAKEKMTALEAELEQTGKQAIDEANAAAPQIEAKAKVYADVKKQMVAAGRSEAEARTTGAIMASRAENLASERYGKFNGDVEAAWKWMQLQIVGPKGKAKGGRRKKLSQSALVPPVLYHGTPAEFTDFILPGRKTQRQTGGKAIFFAEDRSTAEGFARYGSRRIITANVNIEKPFDFQNEDHLAQLEKFVRANFGKVAPGALYSADTAMEFIRSGDYGLLEQPAVMQWMKRKGFDGMRLVEREGQATWAVFDPTKITQIPQDDNGFPLEDGFSSAGDGTTDAFSLQQSTASQPMRGEVSFYPDGRTIVQLFGRADFSTMLHEMSHVFLQQEFTLAKDPAASDELKADIEKLTKWFEANGAGLDENGMPTVDAHELFARTGERYFREGKAPSVELRGAFAQFKDWLTGVYNSVKALLAYGPAPINPEIREIFDRVIATREAIEDNEVTPLSQDELGMTTAEYDAYLESVKGARDAAHDELLGRMMRTIRNREKQRVREARATVRAEIAAQVNAEPRFIALHLLRTGRWLGEPDRPAVPVKINTGWLIDNYGEEVLGQLPVGLQPLHRGDGLVGADIAAMIDPDYTGDALVKDLLDIKQQADALKAEGNPRPLRDHIIETLTDNAMAERDGDPMMSDEAIEEEAIAAINSARQGEVLATELRQLKKTKGAGGVVTPYQMLREWARRKVNEGSVGEAVSKSALQRYIRGFNKARNLFEQAILKGDNAEAIKQKQAQMINHALVAEGKVVADEINKIVRRMQRYAKVKAMDSIDQDYMDRIHELLEGYSFRNVSDVSRAEQASFEEWAEGQRAQGHEVHVPPRFRDNRTNWKDAQVAKLLELNDMVQSLVAQGRLKQRLITARDERELQATIDDVESRVLALPPRKLGDFSVGEQTRSIRSLKTAADWRGYLARLFSPGARVRQKVSELIKIEGLFDILDGTKDATGPLNQVALQPATEAANTFSRLMEEVMDPLVARYRGDRKFASRMHDDITIDELSLNVSIHEADQERLGQPLRIRRSQLITLLLNTGNLSNLSKLVGGERWGDPESATDMARVRDILVSYASKEDMDLVQDIWNGVGKLWPHIVKVERELSGIVPEEVVPVEFDTPFGPYTGGYWPVVWDSTRSEMGKKQGEEAATSLQGVGFGIATPKGHTITRTGAMAPMEWGLEHVLFGHLNKVISRIAYAPWVRDVLKVVDNPRVTGAIRLRLGDEYVAQIKPWIRDQIPSNMIDVAGAKSWEKWVDQLRINFSIAVLGISASTGVAQTLGLGYSAGVLGDGSFKAGGKWMAVGIGKMLGLQKGGFGKAQEFVFARSEEMQRRALEVNQEAITVMSRLRENDTPLRKLQAAAFWHIGFIDMNMVSLPTWLGGYHKALSQGLTDVEASAYADKMVRLSQGSGRKKDLSAIQRGTAAQKFITLFYTPSSVFFNQQWEAAQQIKAGNWSQALAPTFWFLTMTTILDAMREGDWPEDEDNDGWFDELPGWAARNMLFGAFYGIPVVRDVANTAERKLRGEYATYGSTPLTILAETVQRGVKSTGKLIEGEEIEGRDIKNQAMAIGFLFGLPGNQVGKTTGFIKDVYDGRATPDGAGEWFEGLTSGKIKAEQEKK